MDAIGLTPELDVAHIGPPLEKGRLPAVFYFALSAQESLTLDPFNQPALYLADRGVRVFSMDLPSHGPNLNAIEAIDKWQKQFEEGEDPLTPFIEKAVMAIQRLFDKGLIHKEKLGIMGLSRGGYIGCHVASRFPETCAIVGFAPLTQLSFAPQLHLENLADSLCDKTIRFYIGNRDVRVGTDHCFSLVRKLSDRAFGQGIRSAPIEMIVTPSIGHMGHGTAKEYFEAGADWIGKKLGAIR